MGVVMLKLLVVACPFGYHMLYSLGFTFLEPNRLTTKTCTDFSK